MKVGQKTSLKEYSTLVVVIGYLNSHSLGKHFPWSLFINLGYLLALESGSSSSPIPIASVPWSLGNTCMDLGLQSMDKYVSSFLPAMSPGHCSTMTHTRISHQSQVLFHSHKQRGWGGAAAALATKTVSLGPRSFCEILSIWRWDSDELSLKELYGACSDSPSGMWCLCSQLQFFFFFFHTDILSF